MTTLGVRRITKAFPCTKFMQFAYALRYPAILDYQHTKILYMQSMKSEAKYSIT